VYAIVVDDSYERSKETEGKLIDNVVGDIRTAHSNNKPSIVLVSAGLISFPPRAIFLVLLFFLSLLQYFFFISFRNRLHTLPHTLPFVTELHVQ
jgi:hypothetical protein